MNLQQLVLIFPAGNSIILSFAQELSDAKTYDVLITVESMASGKNVRKILMSFAKRRTPLRTTSKISLTPDSRSMRPRTTPWMASLVSEVG